MAEKHRRAEKDGGRSYDVNYKTVPSPRSSPTHHTTAPCKRMYCQTKILTPPFCYLQVVLCSSPQFSSLLARRSSAENRAARRRASSTDVWSKDEGKEGEGKSSKEEGKYTEESECSSTTSSSVASSSASTTTTSTSGSVSGEGYTMSRAITY